MRCQLANVAENTYTLHFDRDLPLLCVRSNLPWQYRSPLMTAPHSRPVLARRLAYMNRVHRPFEIVRPTRTFTAVLSELAVIDGLVEILGVDRYSAQLLIGALFNPPAVALRFAECVRDHFYPGEPIEFAPEVAVTRFGNEVPILGLP